MKTKVFFGVLLSLFLMQSAYSSGALRFILPYLSDIVGMKEGEIAYDSVRKSVVFKNNSSVIPLASSPDVGFQSYSPLIETTFQAGAYPAFLPYVYSYIDAGKIKIGNLVYTNSSAIGCKYNEASLTTGWGFHDGSSKSLTIPSGYLHPMYLYLAADGGNFKCIYSYNSTGPASPYNTRWIRVASIVGKHQQNSFLRTQDGFTDAKGVIVTIPDATGPYAASHLLLASMKYIKFDSFTCGETQEFYILEHARRPNLMDSENVAYAYEYVGGCYTGSSSSPMNYYHHDTNIYYTGGGGSMELRFAGWAEKPLSSL